MRLATVSQNQRNVFRINKSGFKGVYPTSNGKWRVSISIGTFEKKEDAIEAYTVAAKKLHGEFYYDNEEMKHGNENGSSRRSKSLEEVC